MRRKWPIIVVVVAALLVGGVVGAELWLRSRVRDAIEGALAGTGATVEMGGVSVNLPRRSVTLRDVRVKAQNDDVAHRGFTVVYLDVNLGSVTARGIGYKRVGERPALKADRLIIEGPRATFVTRNLTGSTQPPVAAEPPKTLGETFAEKLSSLLIGEISVTGAALEYTGWLPEGGSVRATLGGGNLTASDFRFDSLPAPDRVLFSENIRLAADSIVYGFGEGSKVLRADSLALDTAGRTLSIVSFALVPQFGRDEFAQKSTTHEDWTAVTVGGIACTGFDYGRLFSEKTLAIDTVTLASADIASYKNRKVFSPPRTKQMLYRTVQRLPVPLDIENVNFENLDIRYDELSENGTSPGSVTLTGGHGRAAGITNIVPVAPADRFMSVECTATFMHSGELQAKFLFPVDSLDDHWELTGRLGPTDMGAFNSALEPLMNVKITSGEIRSLDFHVAGTSAASHSKITMAYNDLKVSFLDRRDHTRERKLLTFLADDLLIRPDNPGRGGRGPLREGEGGHTRNPERSMWNYVWHSLLPAMLKTVI